MATTQMNVRIDERAKAEGDAVFERLGYTPTQVVRVIWGCAASLKDNPAAVEKLLREAEQAIDPSPDEEQQRRARAAEDGLAIFSSVLEKMGIDARSLPAHDSDDWIEQARYEHAVEKGWLEPAGLDEGGQAGKGPDYALWHEIAEKVQHG